MPEQRQMTTAAERMRRMRLRKKRGLVTVTVEVPKGDEKALRVFAENLRKIAEKRHQNPK